MFMELGLIEFLYNRYYFITFTAIKIDTDYCKYYTIINDG